MRPLSSDPVTRPSIRTCGALFVTALVAGCSGPARLPGGSALDDVWLGLTTAEPWVEGCAAAYGVSGPEYDFGARGLACRATQAVSAASIVSRAPVRPFASGPHTATASGVTLVLDAPSAFGHYDPAFVAWAAEAAVPTGGVSRALARTVYDGDLARLARAYWLARADLVASGYPSAVPAGPLADYAAYLGGAAVPAAYQGYRGPDTFALDVAFGDRAAALLPALDVPLPSDLSAEWEATTAYGFWLRRRADGTQAAFADGLRGLLEAFDAGWLAAHPA